MRHRNGILGTLALATLVLSLFVLVPSGLGQESSSASSAPSSSSPPLLSKEMVARRVATSIQTHHWHGDVHPFAMDHEFLFVLQRTHVGLSGHGWDHAHPAHGLHGHGSHHGMPAIRICLVADESEKAEAQRFTTRHDLRGGWPSLGRAVPVSVQGVEGGLMDVTWELPPEPACDGPARYGPAPPVSSSPSATSTPTASPAPTASAGEAP